MEKNNIVKLLINIAIVFCLVLFAPLGIALMWWLKKDWSMKTKIIATVAAVLFFGYAITRPPVKNNQNVNTSVVTEQQEKKQESTPTPAPAPEPTPAAPTPAAPAPSPEPTPAAPAPAPKEHYKSCKEMRKVHPQGAVKGDPWYDEALDGDKDGKACEVKGN